jgi:hypothetical protein
MSRRTTVIVAGLASIATAGCGSSTPKVVTSHTATEATTATTGPASTPVVLTVTTPRHVTGSTVMLYGTITSGAEIAIGEPESFHAVNGHWSKRVKLDRGQNFFVIHMRSAAGSPEAGRNITITRVLTPAERAAQLQLQAKRAAQYRKAQRQKAAAQAAHDRAVAQAQARRHEAEAVANGTSEQAISDPSGPGVGYDDTYPGNFAVEFGFEFGMDFGDKYSSSANIESAIQLEQNTPYQAIKKLGIRTIVRLALKKYAQPIG